jgi:hypothetical protein
MELVEQKFWFVISRGLHPRPSRPFFAPDLGQGLPREVAVVHDSHFLLTLPIADSWCKPV